MHRGGMEKGFTFATVFLLKKAHILTLISK